MKPFILAAFALPALLTGAVGLHQSHLDLHRHFQKIAAQKLELTTDQQAAIQKIVEAHRPALRQEAEPLVEVRSDLGRSLVDPKTTEGQIRDLEAKGSAADLVLELEVNQVVKEINPLLSDAQRVKAGQLIAEFHGHVAGFLEGMHAGYEQSCEAAN